jgi:hypothetical protein
MLEELWGQWMLKRQKKQQLGTCLCTGVWRQGRVGLDGEAQWGKLSPKEIKNSISVTFWVNLYF